MNLLIVADKTEAKTYEAIAKTAPNTAVLGAVTRIDSVFISLLGDKYNPHAVLLDTDVTAIGTNIQAAVEEITQTYPYMRILVLTDEDDDYDYPVDCIVQGQLSNIKLKEILTSMASGNTFTDTDSEDDPEDHLPHRIRLERDARPNPRNRRLLYRIPLFPRSNAPFRQAFLRYRLLSKGALTAAARGPIILAGTAAGVLVLVVIVLAVMKGVSGAGQVSTPDEAATTAPFFLFDTQPPTQAMTEDYDYPTLPVEYDTTATVPTTVQPPTIAPEPTAAPRTVPPTTRSEEKPTAAPQTSSSPSSGGSSSGGSSSGGSSSGGSSSSGGNNSGNSNGTSQNSQPATQTYGGEPVVSYDNNGRYSNSGGDAVSSVKLNYSSKTLEVDDTIQLSATVSPSNANQSVSWGSSNSAVVSVNNGKITAKKVGKATITATAGNGKSASCEVTVRKKEQTDSVHLSASEYHISVGQTITVTLYGTSKVTWSVSNSNPVTLTSNKNEAKVKARRKGNTQLYAKDNATGKVYICDIYVG